MLEGLICPACENTIEEIDLRDSFKCPHCSTDLKDRKYLDFLEFLMANGIVENLDFFDQEVYSDDVEDLDQTIAEEGDPRNFDDIPYVLSTTDVTDNPDENRELFREREHTISGLNSFSTAAVKFEFKSTSTVEVPKIKNLRVLAFAL